MGEIENTSSDFIDVIGAREHNLKNIDISIPRDKLVVITGLSGSGKSSLAFDTLFAEGQRRYMETFSAYARQFIGNLKRPDVEKITGLSPVISIEQKTVSKNPRSTVGTITEIYSFLRLLFARTSIAVSPETGENMIKYSEKEIEELILEKFKGRKIIILSPLIKARKGHYREVFDKLRKQGFLKARIDGAIEEIKQGLKLDRYKTHDIDLIVDRIKVEEKSVKRLRRAIQDALKRGKGELIVLDYETNKEQHFSRFLMCPSTGFSLPEAEPNIFSFNSPYGACSKCNGLGEIAEVDITKIIPDTSVSIKNGGIAPLGKYKVSSIIFKQVEAILSKSGVTLDTPISKVPEEIVNQLLYGTDEIVSITMDYGYKKVKSASPFEGIINFVSRHRQTEGAKKIQRWADSFTNKITCPECQGSRLKSRSLLYRVADTNIHQLTNMDLSELYNWIETLPKHLSEAQLKIGRDIIKEIKDRVGFLLNVGLHYLSLNLSAKTLSGGEAQRIRLATQIGSDLTGVLYILDEPSIGLHQRDNTRLIKSLKELRDNGNSVIVVEHDKEIMLESDYLIDIGPGAGVNGGHIVSAGAPKELKNEQSLTSRYVSGKVGIEVPKKRRKGNGKFLELKNATGHNLKNVSIKIPLQKFVCVTGVSGSGKSSLINETLYPILNQHFYKSVKNPLPYGSIKGLENIDKVIEINQSPIGRTPRSNPATYTNLFSDIRSLFANLPESKIRGYKPGRFSFNVKGGRCEECRGAGVKTIEMNFLPDVLVECDACMGRRYNRETLEVRYKGKSINDVLEMPIGEAETFFESIPSIYRKLKTLNAVGLGYVKLGQPSTTLSGGEAQRIKLASELAKKSTGNTFYILDEPSTGLHFQDIKMLLDVLNQLVDSGNTVLVIEHNLDIIKVADYIIDVGLEGGKNGGKIIAKGTPEQIVKKQIGYTAKYLKEELD